jgi:hypothetical protein
LQRPPEGSPRAAACRWRGVGAKAVGRLGQGKVLVWSPELQVVGFVEAERVQHGMDAAVSGAPKTR